MTATITSVPNPLITSDPRRLGGTPCFAGTRVPVQTLFEFLEDGAPLDEFLRGFPNVSREHAIAVINASKAALIATVIEREAYVASGYELAAIDRAREQMARGKRGPKAEMDAVWRREDL